MVSGRNERGGNAGAQVLTGCNGKRIVWSASWSCTDPLSVPGLNFAGVSELSLEIPCPIGIFWLT